MPLARLAVAGLVLAAALGARAGILIEGMDDDEIPHRILVEGQRVRIETVGSHATVFDGVAKRALQLDLSDETYTELTKIDLERIAAARQAGAAAPAPPKPGAPRFERTGRTQQALGRRCDVHRVVESDGTRTGEMCLAPFGNFGVERADLAGFRALGELASEMTGGELGRNWADLPGVPLVSWELEDGAPRETFRATKVEKRAIPPSEFTVPRGWKRNPGFADRMEQGVK